MVLKLSRPYKVLEFCCCQTLLRSYKYLSSKHKQTLVVLEHLNLPSSDYLVIYITFKWGGLDAKTVENKTAISE